MGKRGPTRTPLKALRARGSWLAKHRKGEPQPTSSTLRCPLTISPAARKIWKRLLPQLKAMGTVAACDRDELERYCELLALWRQHRDFIKAHGAIYKVEDKAGNPALVENPQSRAMERLSPILSRMAREFGLTPGGRANMAEDVPSDNDENRGKWERVILGN